MMRRVTMVLVFLVLGLGIYAGSYFWLRSVDGGRWIRVDASDPFADPREPFVTLYKPAVWLEHEIQFEATRRRALLAFLEGAWGQPDGGDFLKFSEGRSCSFRLGERSGEGRVIFERGWNGLFVRCGNGDPPYCLYIEETIDIDPGDPLGTIDVVVVEGEIPDIRWAVESDRLWRMRRKGVSILAPGA